MIIKKIIPLLLVFIVLQVVDLRSLEKLVSGFTAPFLKKAEGGNSTVDLKDHKREIPSHAATHPPQNTSTTATTTRSPFTSTSQTSVKEPRNDVPITFPTVNDRLKIYMGSWYHSDAGKLCEKRMLWKFRRTKGSYAVSLISESSNIEVTDTPTADGIFALDLHNIRNNEMWSPPLRQNVMSVWADAILPVVDLQEFKYSPVAVPLIVQSGTLVSNYNTSKRSIPRLARSRILRGTDEGKACQRMPHEPIVWNFVGSPMRKLLKAKRDLPWDEKKDKALLRVTQSNLESLSNFKNSPIVHTDHIERNPKRYSGLPGDKMPELDIPYKGIIANESEDPMELVHALWSNSVVLLTPVRTQTWTMEDQLQPWIHYIPVDSDLGNLETRMDWVLQHPNEAKKISGRASEWIEELYLNDDAASVNQQISNEIIQRYSAYFSLDDDTTGATRYKVQSTEYLPTTFQAGGRSEAELVDIAKAVKRSGPSVKAAVCYKGIFGSADLHRFIKWATYNYLLGFDQTFLWYLPSIKHYEGFDILESLPYVTMLESTTATVKEVYKFYERAVTDDGRNVQYALEYDCLGDVAKDYDWVMLADSDEYLWFNETIGLREFLHLHSGNYTYLSFGKKMYDRKHGVDIENSGFGLSMYPFHTGRFCDHGGVDKSLQRPGSPICPLNAGRAKVLVNPRHWDHVSIHGTHIPKEDRGSHHFHVDMAHLKEWSGIFFPVPDPEIRDPEDFVVSKIGELTTHHRGIIPNEDGSINVYYDEPLHAWMEFVANNKAG